MTKNNTPVSPWNDDSTTDQSQGANQTPLASSSSELSMATAAKPKKSQSQSKLSQSVDEGFDMEGLMTDFPTATELQKFVYDQTGFALNLKGRSNKLKYQIALDVLNGETPPEAFVTGDNPYVDKNDLVPTDDIKPVPARDKQLPESDELMSYFHTRGIPHPDVGMRSDGKSVDVVFKKYFNGAISYEILGPLEPRNIGEKMDKYGRSRPERITWMDPRTGEQCVKRQDGSLTAIGQKLRAVMQTLKVNDSNQWDIWIDREFISINQAAIENPWV